MEVRNDSHFVDDKGIGMETEIKTLVYRDRAGDMPSPNKRPKMNIAIIATAVMCALVLLTGIVVTCMDSSKSGNTEDLIAQIQNASAEEAGTVAYNPGINFNRYTVEQRETWVAEHCTMVDVLEPVEDKENVIILLAESEEDLFIPMFEGAIENYDSDEALAENDTSENAEADSSDITVPEYESRLDEVEELTSKLTAPDDSPEALVYKYNESMKMELTDKEIEILERIVEAEATDQDVYGRMLVANVVINRVHSKYFANSIEGVVFEKIGGSWQFSPIKDGRYYTVKITDKTREAVSRVLEGEDYSQGALYFFERRRTSSSKATWFDKNLKYLFKYGCHEFFTEFNK